VYALPAMSPGTPCEGLDAALWLNGKGEGLAVWRWFDGF
jgi:hypothetical protein